MTHSENTCVRYANCRYFISFHCFPPKALITLFLISCPSFVISVTKYSIYTMLQNVRTLTALCRFRGVF